MCPAAFLRLRVSKKLSDQTYTGFYTVMAHRLHASYFHSTVTEVTLFC